MNTEIRSEQGIGMLKDPQMIKETIARIQVQMMLRRREKNYEALLHLENQIDELQRKLISSCDH